MCHVIVILGLLFHFMNMDINPKPYIMFSWGIFAFQEQNAKTFHQYTNLDTLFELKF